jgi:transposase
MTTDTARASECNATATPLLMALELGKQQWMVGFTTGPRAPLRRRLLRAEQWERLGEEIAAAKQRFGLVRHASVESCYEAGRDGFWIHRYLTQLGVRNRVVDSASIEVNRRARRAKTDRLDVRKLSAMLYRDVQGERDVWHVVRVPNVIDEDRRQPQRELRALKRDRTRVLNRIGGLLATQGIAIPVRADFRHRLEQGRTWDGEPIAPGLRTRLGREWEKVELLTRQIRAIQRARRAHLHDPEGGREAPVDQVRRLLALRGIGEESAWLLVTELFAWRDFRNRREVGGITGLTGTPYRSGTVEHEQGMSRAGNAQIRAIAIELAWCWLQFQPQSALSRWYTERWAGGGPRAHKIGIVAVARRLMIALWRYVDAGVLPEGARLKPTAEAKTVSAA